MNMLKTSLIVCSFAAISMTANASRLIDGEHPNSRRGHACKKLKLSNNQRSEMRETMKSFRLAMVDLKGEAKKARILYRQTVLDASSTTEQADAAAQAITTARNNIVLAKLGLKNQLLYEVAEPKQRRAMLRCLNKRLHKAKKNRRGSHREHKRDRRRGRGGRG